MRDSVSLWCILLQISCICNQRGRTIGAHAGPPHMSKPVWSYKANPVRSGNRNVIFCLCCVNLTATLRASAQLQMLSGSRRQTREEMLFKHSKELQINEARSSLQSAPSLWISTSKRQQNVKNFQDSVYLSSQPICSALLQKKITLTS